MQRTLSRKQIRALDRYAIDQCHVPGIILMENAGRGAAEVIRKHDLSCARVVVICGTGNNGGDGFVVARHLLGDTENGNTIAQVTACLLGNPDSLQGDARTNYHAFIGVGGTCCVVEGSTNTSWKSKFYKCLQDADVIVDAIFGTGLDRDIVDWRGTAIDAINAAAAKRISLDLPSGLDADTGQVLGFAVRADITITFGALKSGLIAQQARSIAGQVYLVGLGIPSSLIDSLNCNISATRHETSC